MNLTNRLNVWTLGAILTISAIGCRTHPVSMTTTPLQTPALRETSAAIPAPVMAFTPAEQPAPLTPAKGIIPPNPDGSHAGWNEDRLSLKPETVYFDYNKSAIKPGEASKLEEVANYLRGNAGAAIRIEGNCDERGTEEYNRSLGDHRALNAREHLVSLGIEPGRIDSLSNGEDKPAAAGHNEAAWSKNRRDEFVLLTPPNFLSLSGHGQ